MSYKVNPDDENVTSNQDYQSISDCVDDEAENPEQDKQVDDHIYQHLVETTFPRQTASMIAAAAAEEDRSFLNRLFGPIGPGSLRSSTFILMSNMIGVGNLALPNALHQGGLVLGALFLTTGALLGIWSNRCLMTVAFKTNTTKYSDLVGKVLGRKWSNVFQGIFLFYMFGTMTNFQVVAAGFLQDVLSKVFGVPDNIINASWEKPVQILAINCLLYWVARAKDLYALRYITFVTVGVLLYTTIVVLVQSPSYFAKFYDPSLIQYANFNIDAFSAYAVTAFSYFCQGIILPIKSELAKPAKRRMIKVITRSFASIWVLYIALAVVGYLSLLGLGDNQPQVIPNRPALGPHDYAMNVARAFLAVNIMFGIAIRLNPTRLQLHLVTGKPQDAKWNEIYTFILLFGSAGLAIAFPDVYSLMTIIGGFGAVSLAYFFPGLIYVTFRKKDKHWKVYVSWVLLIVSTMMGLIPTIIKVVTSIVNKIHHH